MPELRILEEADVRAAIDAPTALDIARRTLAGQAAGTSYLSSPSAMVLAPPAPDDPTAKFKAASVGWLGLSGVRILANPLPGRTTANYCALWRHTDQTLAGLVSERWLSGVRTAAFGVAAIEALVNPGPVTVALFGTGAIAHEIVPLLAHALPVAAMRVSARRPESMAAFVAAHASNVTFPMHVEPDARRAAAGAQVIVTLTEAREPLVSAATVAPGAVVCSMGSHNEVDHDLVADGARLVVDDPDFAGDMGDGRAWIAQGHYASKADFERRVDARMCDIVAGRAIGRTRPDERIVALMQGMAMGDVAFAAHALRAAEREGRGMVVMLG